VTLSSVLTVGLVAVLAHVVISQLAGIDVQSIWAELASADFAWLLGALLVSPAIQVRFPFATLGASMVALRYWPVLMLQYAIPFIALVLPATAARLALEIRFFEKYGIAAGAAVADGAEGGHPGDVPTGHRHPQRGGRLHRHRRPAGHVLSATDLGLRLDALAAPPRVRLTKP
jgi:hypothetical protein